MEQVMARIRKHEGYSLTPYFDHLGKLTVGIGHKLQPGEPRGPWSAEAVEAQFERDVYAASDAFMRIKRERYPDLDLVRSEVLVEMIFWIGLGGTLNFTEMQRALRQGDYRLAALELYNSNLGKDPLLRGRARDLAELMWEGA